MRTHTNDFKEELKVFGRQIQGKIIYYPSFNLISESEDNILSESDLQLISEQANYNDPIEINEDDIFSISIIKNGNLLQSLMKEFDFEAKVEFNIGSVVNPQFGLLVNEDYEYLNYGNYIINSKEYNIDTDTWSYVCYDKMLFSMVKYKGIQNAIFPITVKQYLQKLCEKVGLELSNKNFINENYYIYDDYYKNKNMTIRDIFDEISKVVGGNLLINDDDKVEIGFVKNTIGKNIFDLETFFNNCSAARCTKELVDNGIKISFNAGTDCWVGDAVRNGSTITDTIKNTCIAIQPLTEYVLSISSMPRCYISYLDNDYIPINQDYISIPSSYTQTSYNFTTPDNAKYVLFRFGIRNNNYTEWTFSNIQLEEGNTATSYEEYGLDKINGEYLKDTDVRISNKIGPVNSVAIYDSENNNQYIIEDNTLIKQDGLSRITITDNAIALNGNTEEIADNIFDELKGLYYYQNDVTTTGVCYYDFLDLFNIEARGTIYQCLLLNNEITISQGIEEHIFTENFEEKETNTTEYTTSTITNKELSMKSNQQDEKLKNKVEKDGIISAINQSPEAIQIQANKLSFTGATIDMSADNVKIQGNNLKIDSSGIIELNDDSAESALTSTDPTSAYIINSKYQVETQGNIENLSFKNQIFADGTKAEVVDSWEYNGEVGSFIQGIKQFLYSQPRLILYSQSSDYDVSTQTGQYNDLWLGLNSISYNSYNNGVSSTPLLITSGGEITCVSVTQTSKKESKKNFEKITNAKEILNATDIYKYNFKDENDEDKKSIGFVIGDDFNYSQEITSKNNDGANIYSMVSVLWQVVKEQQEEIKELKEMIKNGKY